MKRKPLSKVRFGIVGLGFIGSGHASRIAKAKDKDFCLSAVADSVASTAAKVGKALSVPFFSDPEEMFHSGLCDAVVIATPHYLHPVLGIQAARAGLHVLSEKPIAASVGPARRLVAECRDAGVALGAMLQRRAEAQIKKIKRLVERRALGEIYHASMICSHWFRTQAYYDSGDWRGTWSGEGGGILLNQAPHDLDIFQWIVGMPRAVMAVLGTRLHKIEVENTAEIICDYGAGKTAHIYATTAQLPGVRRLTLCGDKGTLIFENQTIHLGRLSVPISRHIVKCKEDRADFIPHPKCNWRRIESPGSPGGTHMDVIRPFARHILRGAPMVASGQDALNVLELSNATYISGFKRRSVDIPVDAAEMERLLSRLQREHPGRRGGGLLDYSRRQLKKLAAQAKRPEK